jgi:hypothetical protein
MNVNDIEKELKEELAILGISGLCTLTSKDIQRKRVQLMKIYHPDMTRNFSRKERDFYEERAKSINNATDKVLSFLYKLDNNPIMANEDVEVKINEELQIEEVSGITIQSMQETINNLWYRIRKTNYKMNEKTVTLSSGISVNKMIDIDIEYEIYDLAFSSIFGASLMYFVVFLIVYFILQENTDITNFYILNLIFKYSIITHLVASVIVITPFSRFWLNRNFFNIMISVVKLGEFFYTSISGFFNFLYRIVSNDKELSQSDCCIPSIFCHIYFFIPVLLSIIFKIIIINPIYCTISALFGKIIVGRVEKKTRYYAAYPESYIEELINKKPDEFSEINRIHLLHIYSELKNA